MSFIAILFLVCAGLAAAAVVWAALLDLATERDRACAERDDALECHEALWREYLRLQRKLAFHAQFGALRPDDARKQGQTPDRCLCTSGPEELACASCVASHDGRCPHQ